MIVKEKKLPTSIASLIESYRNGCLEARNMIIEYYMINAESIARQYFGLGVEEEDLIQIAYEGLILAIDECRERDLKNYPNHIRRKIEYLVKKSIANHYLHGFHANPIFGGKLVNTLKMEKALILELGRKPSMEEISERFGCSVSEIKCIFEELNRRGPNIEEMELTDLREIQDAVSDVDFDMLHDVSVDLMIKKVSANLDDIPFTNGEWRLIDCYKNGMTNSKEIEAKLGITRQGVGYLKMLVLTKLKAALNQDVDEYLDACYKRKAIDDEIIFTYKRKKDRMQR